MIRKIIQIYIYIYIWKDHTYKYTWKTAAKGIIIQGNYIIFQTIQDIQGIGDTLI